MSRGWQPNLCCVDGRVQRLDVRKRPGTYSERAGRVAAAAIGRKAHYFAIRAGGGWELWSVLGPRALKIGLTEPQVRALLWHKEMSHARA